MFKQFTIVGCLVGASFFVACNEQDNNAKAEEKIPPTEQNRWKPEEVKASELAQLMRTMYDENMRLKEKIKNGEEVSSFPEEYKHIHSARATDPSEITEAYTGFADLYLSAMSNLTSAPATQKTLAFNQTVDACISCHQQYCQGPIVKIKKLYIKE